ncbi:DUF3037 domain-containing protein [Phaeodactylibacter sp.]|jgi:hypothetical protein|uniref:DUF3037 domain-containing protein n=1 Tax=Phaeodactylibacter sp. TaxID=1940289 RepID=UPI0025DB4CE3|nr:DUF3037 domain-containing protein [Phaeodactylibacter sp.]MCI4648184.1 DUF3037 domain-containing protein [Phaeodactylibacter sp.]MCI5091961.1 DUF3037 domain-containing protein [Phaeodactylibacter sp.]
MQNRVTYEYAVVRLVPKVEREEFLNIGVILFSKRKRFLGIRYQIDEAKVKAFSKETDVDMVRRYLKAWEAVCGGGRQGGKIGELDMPSRFRWLVAARSTIIQSSPTHPGLCHDPEAVLERLYQRYVL